LEAVKAAKLKCGVDRAGNGNQLVKRSSLLAGRTNRESIMTARRTPIVFRLETRDTPSVVSAVGVDPGAAGWITASDANHQLVLHVAPFGDAFTGGIQVAVADVNGDGQMDVVAAAGEGRAPTVVVYDGASLRETTRFDAYESTFTGGVNLAAADFNQDGHAEIITGADLGGGPRVRVLDGDTIMTGSPVAMADFIAFDDVNFRGGVRIAVGDLSGDGVADLVVGAGVGGGPRVSGYNGVDLAIGQQKKLFTDFFSNDSGLRNGASVGIRDVTGDGVNDLVFGVPNNSGLHDRYVSGSNGAFINQAYTHLVFGPDSVPAFEYFLASPGNPTIYFEGQPYDQMLPYLGSNGITVDIP
jgi:hypothetical protein